MPVRARDFSLYQNVQNGSGAPHSGGTGVLSPEKNSLLFSAEVENEWRYTFALPVRMSGAILLLSQLE